ncbi:MAG: type IV secretion system protein [Formosimonas sp.]
MQGLSGLLNGVADVVWYNSIRGYISTRIDYFLEHTLSGTLTIVGTIALSAMTLWIMFQGFMIVTGRSQDGFKGFLVNAFRSYLIVLVATGMAAGSAFSVRTLTDTLTTTVAQVVTGSTAAAKCLEADSAFLGCKVDRNLQVMQASMNFVGQLDTADDPILEDKKARAGWFVGIGTAGPALVTGTMLLLYKVMMAMFIGFGPIFILSLLFKRTAHLFGKWLYYGVATIFSSMVLAVMSDISMDLVENVAGALFVADLLGVKTAGMMQAATQQLGLGLLLSTLLLSVPPMAGSFFGGMMGSFNGQNGLGNMAGSAVPSGAGAGVGANQTGLAGATGLSGNAGQSGGQRAGGSAGNDRPPTQTNPVANRVSQGQAATTTASDTVKQAGVSHLGNASAGKPAATTTAGSEAASSTDAPKSANQVRQEANAAYADRANSNSTGNWGTAQMAAPPSDRTNAATQQLYQQNAASHGGGGVSLGGSAPTASAVPPRTLSGSQNSGNSDVVKPRS